VAQASSCARQLNLRILPGSAVRPAEQLVRFRVADHALLLAVPLNAAPGFGAQHAQQAHHRGAVADLDVAGRTLSALDGGQEIGVQLLDVLGVGRVEFGLGVDDVFLLVGRIECPAVQPAHVERALGAVEVAADVGLLGVVMGILAVFPRGGEGLELERRHLGVGRGG